MSDAEAIVLGGGISGCLTACQLADEGMAVLIVDQHPELMSGASLWNDGKIHLGYTFTGTPSLATASLMQEGAAVFRLLIERVTGSSFDESWFGEPVIYLVDRDSMFDAETLWSRAQAVASLLTSSMDRLPGLAPDPADAPVLARLSVDDAMAETGQGGIVAAWRTSERHVSPRAIARLVRAAVAARGIPVIRGRVEAVQECGTGWRVTLDDGTPVSARAVVNALWECRVRIDRQIEPSGEPVSIRYKHALFGEGITALGALASSTRIVGRYGDVATYANGDAYLSWHPASLAARSDDGVPPVVPEPDRERIIAETLGGLGLASTVLDEPGARWQVGGGHVVAHGSGDIDDVASPLHERHRPGVRELRPGFVTVDTGKYTLGPLLAARAAKLILAHRSATRDAAKAPWLGLPFASGAPVIGR